MNLNEIKVGEEYSIYGGVVIKVAMIDGGDSGKVQSNHGIWYEPTDLFPLTKAPKTLDNLEVGDVVNNTHTGTRKVLAVVGKLYALSDTATHDSHFSWYTANDMFRGGYKTVSNTDLVTVNGKQYRQSDIEQLEEVK